MWYGGLLLTSRLAEPMLSKQASMFKGLGAVLPLPTRIWMTLDAAHLPLFTAVAITIALIATERIFDSPASRDLVHSIALALLLFCSAATTIAILMALGNIIEKLS